VKVGVGDSTVCNQSPSIRRQGCHEAVGPLRVYVVVARFGREAFLDRFGSLERGGDNLLVPGNGEIAFHHAVGRNTIMWFSPGRLRTIVGQLMNLRKCACSVEGKIPRTFLSIWRISLLLSVAVSGVAIMPAKRLDVDV